MCRSVEIQRCVGRAAFFQKYDFFSYQLNAKLGSPDVIEIQDCPNRPMPGAER